MLTTVQPRSFASARAYLRAGVIAELVTAGQEWLAPGPHPDVLWLAGAVVDRLLDVLGAVELAVAVLNRRCRADDVPAGMPDICSETGRKKSRPPARRAQ
jgi:hypothetical protein